MSTNEVNTNEIKEEVISHGFYIKGSSFEPCL